MWGNLRTKISRQMVAKEAARLLYFGVVEEYKEAKEKATALLGVGSLPSNIEIAYEVDKLADEIEGSSRKELLVKLRKEALKIMHVLNEFYPRLIGSVWRGTCHKGSDIDLVVFASEPEAVINTLKENGYTILRTEWKTKIEDGEVSTFFHIYFSPPSIKNVEVVVNSPERFGCKEICEIYGDFKKGLTIAQLQAVLKMDPTKKFVPKKEGMSLINKE